MPFRSRRMGTFIKSVTANLGQVAGGAEESLVTSVANFSVIGVQLVEDEPSAWDGKVKFEASNDGENWEDLEVVDVSDATSALTITATGGDEGFFIGDVAGIQYVRISSDATGANGYVEVIVTKE